MRNLIVIAAAVVAAGLAPSAYAQPAGDPMATTTTTTEDDGDRDFPWGLLGLIGLAGLMGRNRDKRHDTVHRAST